MESAVLISRVKGVYCQLPTDDCLLPFVLRYHAAMPRNARTVGSAQGTEENQRLLRIEELSLSQLANHLHNGPIQDVAALAMRAHLAKRQLATNPAAARDEVEQLEMLARRTASDLRYLQFTLIPQSLEGSDLEGALRDLARQNEELFGQKVQVTIKAREPKALNKTQQRLLFHLAAEALDNARLHARAATVKLNLDQPESGVLLLEVEDDGQGFDLPAMERAAVREGKFGLALMRERVKQLHGELHMRSTVGAGSLVRVAIPISGGKE